MGTSLFQLKGIRVWHERVYIGVYHTHPEALITEYVEGNLVPDDIRTSVCENDNDFVLVRHQADCVGQSKIKGLACVCGLSQPPQVPHFPVHKHRNVMTQKSMAF